MSDKEMDVVLKRIKKVENGLYNEDYNFDDLDDL